jgi:hypothetical protein
MTTPDRYTFLSWVRDGVAARITQPETLADTLPHRAMLRVQVEVESYPSQRIDTATVNLAVYGPGDVRLLQRDEIVRVDPSPGTAAFDPHCIASVEFDRPDLPWLFSPMRGSASNRQKLRPWLCLVVLHPFIQGARGQRLFWGVGIFLVQVVIAAVLFAHVPRNAAVPIL